LTQNSETAADGLGDVGRHGGVGVHVHSEIADDSNWKDGIFADSQRGLRNVM